MIFKPTKPYKSTLMRVLTIYTKSKNASHVSFTYSIHLTNIELIYFLHLLTTDDIHHGKYEKLIEDDIMILPPSTFK